VWGSMKSIRTVSFRTPSENWVSFFEASFDSDGGAGCAAHAADFLAPLLKIEGERVRLCLFKSAVSRCFMRLKVS